MTVRYLSSETERLSNQTVSGIDICATLVAKAAYTEISKNEYMPVTPKYFDPSNVHVKVLLRRNGIEHTLISENLALLSRYATITQGRDQWEDGVRLAPTEDAHNVYIPFSGNTNFPSHINLKGDDILEVYVNVVRGAYGSKLDANACIFDVRATPSIGIETHIPFISSFSVRANQASETVQAGNNVMRVALMSMSDDDLGKPNAFTDVTLNSDRLDISFNSNQLLLQHSKSIEDSVTTHANNVDTYLIHEDIEVDNCKISLKMNPKNIRENTIYVVFSRFLTSLDILQKAQAMQVKHESADLAKAPVSL
ncbi:MAG: major capsid protein [Bacteriophage sp.]|nr:MAG: major capsid protein [Bacteriophage sp.]